VTEFCAVLPVCWCGSTIMRGQSRPGKMVWGSVESHVRAGALA
jgi:hypothetical protein